MDILNIFIEREKVSPRTLYVPIICGCVHSDFDSIETTNTDNSNN